MKYDKSGEIGQKEARQQKLARKCYPSGFNLSPSSPKEAVGTYHFTTRRVNRMSFKKKSWPLACCLSTAWGGALRRRRRSLVILGRVARGFEPAPLHNRARPLTVQPPVYKTAWRNSRSHTEKNHSRAGRKLGRFRRRQNQSRFTAAQRRQVSQQRRNSRPTRDFNAMT